MAIRLGATCSLPLKSQVSRQSPRIGLEFGLCLLLTPLIHERNLGKQKRRGRGREQSTKDL